MGHFSVSIKYILCCSVDSPPPLHQKMGVWRRCNDVVLKQWSSIQKGTVILAIFSKQGIFKRSLEVNNCLTKLFLDPFKPKLG
jgi:hypothetical protein